MLTLPGEGNTYDDVYCKSKQVDFDSTITGTKEEVDQTNSAQGLGSPLKSLHQPLHSLSRRNDEYQFCESATIYGRNKRSSGHHLRFS